MTAGILIRQKRYKPKPYDTKAHKIMNCSIFNKPQFFTISALDKNLNASASSKNPITTFTELSQDPDLGNLFIKDGKVAKMANGRARERPNPPIPTVSCTAPPFVLNDPANKDPSIGPVHENETSTRVRAIKNIPMKQPTPSS